MMTLGVSYGLIYVLMSLFILVAAFMMLVILIQKPKGGGLSGAFGGGGGSEGAAFGAKAGDVLTMITIGSFVGFLVLAIALNLIVNDTHSVMEDELNADAKTSQTEIEKDLANEAVQPEQPQDTALDVGPAEEAADGPDAKSEVEVPQLPAPATDDAAPTNAQ